MYKSYNLNREIIAYSPYLDLNAFYGFYTCIFAKVMKKNGMLARLDDQ
jgi:hypothetical protein